ncbi:Outer membrane TonB-dependent transporter, utilization system for glycans and polysaccharides (PUL), SusC family [hydrothermal vent metagenome]|uniref:Outer membrane TonB-dependent transporter, utilization system for glycans and polysaccharides (PUL), SusC family n=1 Tax=hydrothermal vent metagenome TaxID=652676 RepID=A0A3B0TU68_9ZZZZ
MKKNCCDNWLTFKKLWATKTFLSMRLTFYVLLLATIQSIAIDSYAQATKLNLSLSNTSVKQVLSEIEDVSEFYFLYNSKIVDVERKVDVKFKNKKIDEALDLLFKDTPVSYNIVDRQIVLSSIESMGTNSLRAQQQKTITGKVTDEAGQPLPGVTVVVKGTTQGTITDTDGNFLFADVPGDATLVFSFVGMRTQEIVVGNQAIINLTLVESTIGIDEVVAIGYGTQKKANLTGAVGMATSERLENRPIASTGMGLQGVIPNLNISIRNGDPTTAAIYNIRGYASINGGSPLILVDGVPMALERINPNDIASVSVLKDASAAAVYGARAAFGVILVETKKGKGKLNITLSTEQSMAKPIFMIDPVTDPYVFVTARNTASKRTKGVNGYDDNYVEGTKRWVENPTFENEWGVVNGVLRYYGNNDYQHKVITDFAPQQKYGMTISGASEKASYYVSFGFLNKDGYLRNSEKNERFKRYNILMKADFKVNDWLSLDEKITFDSQVSDKPHSYNWDVDINSVTRVGPVTPIRFPDLPYYIEPGDHDKYAPYIGMYFDAYPKILPPYLEQGGRTTFTINDIWLTQGITLTPLKGLKIRSDFSYNTYFRNYQDVASKVEMVTSDLTRVPMITNGFSLNDWIKNQTNYNQYYVFNAYAEYTLEQFAGHYLKAMVGFNQEWGRNTYIRAQANTLITPLITDLNATTGTQQTWGGKSHAFLRGVFYRLNYIYKDKYLLEANGRYDGTSRFPKDSRFGFFPSFSVGWRISNENFMGATRGWLDNLKLRASYGALGNQLLGSNYYPYIPTMGSGVSNYMMSSAGRIPYVSAAGLVSPSLTWETVATQNLGLDITLLGQKLDISADIYTRDTKNMLMKVEYPDLLGTSAPDANAADLRTKGWELSVTWRDKISQDWQYGLNLALSDNQAEITKYDNPTGALSAYYVGQKIGEIWGYVTEGIFQTNDEVASHADQSQLGFNWREGDIKYADLNNDGKINAGNRTLADPGDRKVIGNAAPRYSFGINSDVSYKNWTLNLFFQGLFRDYLPYNSNWVEFYPYQSGIVQKYYLTETWSEDNRDAYFAAPSLATSDKKNIQPQSRYVQNAAYVRLKNLTLNYNLPQGLVSKAGLSRVQVYLSGMNLWEYTKMHKPLDPESVFTLEQEYYLQRIYTLGAKITF